MSSPEVRFYFSFRSPYSWLALERWEHSFGELSVTRKLIPVYPPPGDFPNDPTAVPQKFEYMIQDLVRLTQAFGLSMMPPASVDTDWANAHAAYLAAHEAGEGDAFALALSRARWCESKDIGVDAVISETAQQVGLDANEILEGAHDESKRDQVIENMVRGREQDRIFGVPTFLFNGQMFWGHDRMEYLVTAVKESLSS